MKILVANRGEIALRVMRTIRDMGHQSVAVYSDADRMSLFVQFADEAVHIGASPSSESYLNPKKILDAAAQTKCDAIHPGYGFLSENDDFVKAVEKAGLIFIGPSASSMHIMGNKLRAKEAVKKFNIPFVPGTDHPVEDATEAKKQASKIGYPVLIKAAAGGGGKGMRMVEQAKDIQAQFERAVSEAKTAFGDGSVFIEKYIQSPRHIEIQVMMDRSGMGIHLFERECSIQRRHQKVIEEAPSVLLNDALRNEIGQMAIDVARSCKYEGAGTVEFMVDTSNKKKIVYYFLEMNTRLQVEHPVTEMITGLDLVEMQIDIAQGKPLNIKQSDLRMNGHAIELRVYAEDPESGFLPNTGTLEHYSVPNGPGVRVDGGYVQQMDIPVEYDPLISKLIVHASTRTKAISRMHRAIQEYKISGLHTTLPFGSFVMEHKVFRSGSYDTNFVRDHYEPALNNAAGQRTKPHDEGSLIAALVAFQKFNERHAKISSTPANGKGMSNWRKSRTFEE